MGVGGEKETSDPRHPWEAPVLWALQADRLAWYRLRVLSHVGMKKQKRITPTLLRTGGGKNNQAPHFLAFDMVFIEGNLVFTFMANVHDFEPGTLPPCVPLGRLYPISRAATFAIV